MATLIFEIWRDEKNNSFGMGSVSAHGDAMRRKISPHAVLIYRFEAHSDLQALQMNYDFHGWGLYPNAEDVAERFFTASEEEEQRQYLLIRDAQEAP